MNDQLHLDCPACDGVGLYMGTLGRLEWYCCDDCGIQFNYLVERGATPSEEQLLEALGPCSK